MAEIPKGAKCVFEGEIFDVYQWEQELYDGSTATFEMLDREDTAEIIAVTEEGKILVQEEIQPSYTETYLGLTAGRIERGEDPLVGAKRELLEETGYVSDDWELLYTRDPSHKMSWTMYVYVARHAKKTQEQSLDPGEKITVHAYTLDELMGLVDRDEIRYIDEPLRRRLLRAIYDPEEKKQFELLLTGRG